MRRKLITQGTLATFADRPERLVPVRVPFTARLLLTLIIISLPFQDALPTLGPLSVSFLLFAFALVYLYVVDIRPTARTAKHPVFIALLGMVAIGLITEGIHSSTSFGDMGRIAQMAAGALVIASLCRDRRTLTWGLYGLVGIGAYLALRLFLTAYGVLKEAEAFDFHSANKVRTMAIDATELRLNANTMASYVGIAASISLAFGLTARDLVKRYFFLGVCVFCTIAAFLPVSRSGALGVVLACVIVGLSAGAKRRLQMVLITIALASAVATLVPETVWPRMTFSTKLAEGKQRMEDPRAHIYQAFFANAPEFLAVGVGSGNFWDYWAVSHGFTRGGGALGAHNCFFQVTIYWGIAGLVALVIVVWLTKRCLPPVDPGDPLTLALRGMATALLVLACVNHVLWAKQYSLGLGLLAGSHCWIWARQRVERRAQSPVLEAAAPADAR